MVGTLAAFDVELTPVKVKQTKEELVSPVKDLEVGNELEEVTGSRKLYSPRKRDTRVGQRLHICTSHIHTLYSHILT